MDSKLHTGSHRGVIDPDTYVCTIEQDLLDSRIGVVKSTVRPFDRQRGKVKRVRRDVTVAPVLRATINLNGRHGIRSEAAIARTISSRRPA